MGVEAAGQQVARARAPPVCRRAGVRGPHPPGPHPAN
eukprot:CAMPEP_0179267526 /NCGR_PEP_ID=MMETSP0797-20121207/29972_1 /TAXON_ID=47934 /ORGANISM="Dinophysis acuminata, Strain DAEP01" /LENGTH=36 /DNA_ID= /DNA_START= /DNA_END= /DNA_ORIENTATION=